MISLGRLVLLALDIYFFIVVAAVVLHWLMYFQVINLRNQFVAMVSGFLYAATEPLYRRMRRFIPTVGNFDLSPIVVILLIIFAQSLIYEYWITPLLRHG